ncbi:collagen-like protein [Aestuariibacter sp. GS-14]|uniref:choice-of-anchor I family protein n=1 Tax=Aestuariibacter sp. GS-14 TaxID=2590670 RepID=UPI00112AB34B|nr:choice-of-anchor I family protein [Aestuariibacter sp. GS-14]TPV52755.1 collagen-like protein [Aestuariibacter sp. GS-14]
MIASNYKASLLALAIAGLLGGCSLEGDDGQDGATGAQGSQGESGANGADGQDALQGIALSVIGRATLNAQGAAEIVQYDVSTNTIYVTNSDTNSVEMVSTAALTTEAMSNPITSFNMTTGTSLALPTEIDGVALAGLTSIALSGDLLAVAVPADNKSDNGYILFYTGVSGSAPVFLKAVEVGNLPDMVTFTPDGTKVLVANEGEPSGDYTIDPEGSVAVIAVADGVPADTASIVDFTAFNNQKAALTAMGMHFPNPEGRTINGVTITTSVAQDLEPEYITTNNETAFVTLQENNGVAVIDLTTLEVSIVGLGFKDWSELNIDAQEDGEVSFGKYAGLYGVYMPDTIAMYTWKDAPFLLTANEGDAREYFIADDFTEAECTAAGGQDFDDGECLAFTEEVKLKNLTAAPGSLLEALQINGDIDDLRVTNALGDTDGDGQYDAAYTYGARSFTIWDQNGLVVFDSGDDFERITASIYGAQFNNGDDENEGDSRSENKGPEPEALTVGKVGERTYAFIGLERMGGIFIYDITNPYDAFFVDYINNRDVTEGLTVDDAIGDLAPESLLFVAAEDSVTGLPMLIAGNEVSGTVAVYGITAL